MIQTKVLASIYPDLSWTWESVFMLSCHCKGHEGCWWLGDSVAFAQPRFRNTNREINICVEATLFPSRCKTTRFTVDYWLLFEFTGRTTRVVN